jgi:hypothetical protein
MKHTGDTGKSFLRKYTRSILLMGIFVISGLLVIGSINNTNLSPFPIFATVKADPVIDYNAIEEEIGESQNPVDDLLWHTTRYEMLIIVPDAYHSTMQPLADWKNEKGVATKIVNATEYMSFPGVDTAERIRNCIRSYYLIHPIQWVLLAGDTDLIPTRYVYNPDTIIVGGGNNEAGGSESEKPTDFYYAELTGNWNPNNNDRWGESWDTLGSSSFDEIDWQTEVYVGRFPGRNAGELSAMVQKTINYEENPTVGNWMKKSLFATGTQVWPSSSDTDGELEYWLGKKIIEESIPADMTTTHLTYSPYFSYNLSTSSMDSYIDSGSSLVFFAGHGSPSSMVTSTSTSSQTSIYNTVYGSSSSNTNMLSLFYSDACSTNFFDGGSDCLGEVLIKRANAGAIGFIGGARLTWFYRNDTYGTDDDLTLCEMNRGMARLFYQSMFQEGNYQQGKALYEMKKMYLNSRWLTDNPIYSDPDPLEDYNIHTIEWERKNVLTYTLLGDPETDIYTEVAMTFDDTELANPSGFYEGQEIELQIVDSTYNFPVSYARVAIMGDDGAYNSFTANIAGYIKIRLPRGVQDYSYTITAHNMVPFKGSFTTMADANAPYFTSDLAVSTSNPTVDTQMGVSLNVADDETAVASSYFVLSTDNFATYAVYPMTTDTQRIIFEVTLPRLDPGTFSYISFIFDYAGNSNHTIWTNAQIFTIPIPLTILVVVGMNIIVGVGIAWYIARKKPDFKEYERTFASLQVAENNREQILVPD